MKHNYKNKNWVVCYFTKPLAERITPQDCSWIEGRFDNYEMAEHQASDLEKSPNIFDVRMSIWDGDDCIEEII